MELFAVYSQGNELFSVIKRLVREMVEKTSCDILPTLSIDEEQADVFFQ
ncbi:hypothetical protein APHWI1_0064 [Anaplasma phagocytophilum str. ApWI1]|uniref:Uncharacterized protein n=2 Tax=Anaplasma phagocytophilum TaxID=948 RepID=A0A0F3NEC4_ANAPH|nr:hypothetical protein APHWEB_1436 [Anaplasma phagocytophilum str. Webster]KJV65269.1 hypothetical protein EPHNCH_0875 [Anaplasma phagocytophilum str. NCH-1]KJV83442.1 hypothetical protein APHHGE2_0862 [Anaplasma phagocytophilum str. HGE2]KJV85354.1 hypothetical protein APHWI1_0064 [Anaplasma phagocytophilum str. ApWI1]KJV87709.1 hypothetical protein APHNYW_0603 [Anaplasma phagocytophilum str. ApNYW]KJV98916.1 hypothetical protein OTSANNIE_0831 [Anaplasma phagocytophilum str. Annie]KJZ98102.